ncbi:MAG: DUF5683 domain-containing protein [Bacteroidales bacterium]|jgi:hypothetical protein|nr:DUF5683 domain-containing protein [Bacteroidales bacterium]
MRPNTFLQRYIYILSGILLIPAFVLSQSSDSLSADTLSQKPKTEHSPKKATIYSAVVPGLGQVYNKSYWKVPVIYGGFAGLGYIISQNHIFYSDFRDVYNSYLTYAAGEEAEGRTPNSDTLLTVRGLTSYSIYNVKEGRDYFRRRRDLAIIGIGAWYVLQIIEAYVDAHMFSFDISDDLSLHYRPTFFDAAKPVSGLTISVRF